MVNSIDSYQLIPVETLTELDEFFEDQSRPDNTLDPHAGLSDVCFQSLGLEDDIGHYKLQDAYHEFTLDTPGDIPFIIWLLENPKSALALPGKIDLYGHDCIHLLLNRGKTNFDEAFIIGFTMGNDDATKEHHLKIFEMFATKIYPPIYRFNKYHMKSFYLGFEYGRNLTPKGVNLTNFKLYSKTSIQTLRESLGIHLDELRAHCAREKLWMQMSAAFA